MNIWKDLFLVFTGFSSGIAIAGGVFSFIAIIGIVPRMAHKTGTIDYIKIYEKAIITGGILGSVDLYYKFRLPLGSFGAVAVGLAMGVFVGVLAMALAEVLNVIPVFMKRGKFTKCLSVFVAAMALGKLTGGLIYYTIPNFY